MSTVIVFPPNFFLVLFFRRCRQKKNAIMQANQQVHKRNQRYRWKNVGNTSAIWGEQVNSETMMMMMMMMMMMTR